MMDVEIIFDSDREEYEFMKEKKEQQMKEQIEEMRNEQIGEMAKSVDEALAHNVSWNSQNGVIAYSAEGIARELFDDGYRKQEWISVKDRLPKHEERCLIFTKIHFVPDHVDECDYYEGVEVSTFYKDFGFLSNNGMYATHWMPLPEPPKMKGGAE